MTKQLLQKHPMYIILYEIDKNKDKNKKINKDVCNFFGINSDEFFLYQKTQDEFVFHEIKFNKNGRLNTFKIKKSPDHYIIFNSMEFLLDINITDNKDKYLNSNDSVFSNFKNTIFKDFKVIYESESNKIKINKFNHFNVDFEKDYNDAKTLFEDKINSSSANEELKEHLLRCFHLDAKYNRNTQTYFETFIQFSKNVEFSSYFDEVLFNE